jgi:hypothetical protein
METDAAMKTDTAAWKAAFIRDEKLPLHTQAVVIAIILLAGKPSVLFFFHIFKTILLLKSIDLQIQIL